MTMVASRHGVIPRITACLAFLVASIVLVSPHLAWGACNIIPGTTATFRGALGSADRPFAGPGDFVELHLNPCDKTSAGFSINAAAQVVSVVFTPPSGSRNVVILSTECTALESQRQSCASVPNVASATCVQVNQPLQPIGMEVVDVQGVRRLRFRFPSTGGLGGVPEHTFSGPATIAVTAASAPLPCDLANTPCAGHADVLACIDSLFALEGTCGQTPDTTFSHFTALPPPNNFQAVCSDPVPPCNGTASEARFTVDSAGNVLMPMDWRGILVGEGVPIARLLQASASVEAFIGGGQPIRVPSNAFLHSFSPEGRVLPPIFDPQAAPTAVNESTFFGSADAPATILRLARRGPTLEQCYGGTNDGLPCFDGNDCPSGSCAASTCSSGSVGTPCTADSDCGAGGECGPALFEFRGRFLSNVGPVVVSRFGAGVCQDGLNVGQTAMLTSYPPAKSPATPSGSLPPTVIARPARSPGSRTSTRARRGRRTRFSSQAE